jgi:4-amino-4-deoxy-L-arabinose transferase-like glycosyltransferase
VPSQRESERSSNIRWTGTYWVILTGAVVLAMAWRFSILLLPPHGQHVWRDADGLGVARSFLSDGFHILFPRVVERGAGSGIVGMEFPLVNWLGALSMELFGQSDGAARLPVWLCVPLLALGMRALARRILVSDRASYVAAAFVVLQPLVVVFSHKQMPDVPMVTSLCWGLVLCFDGFFEGNPARAWLCTLAGGCLFALAAVLKPTGVAVAVPIASWFLRAFRERKGNDRWDPVRRLVVVSGLPVAAVVLWFQHSRSLDAIGGNPLFHLHQDFWEWTHLIYTWPFFSVVFGRCLHLFLLWSTVALMVWRWRALGAALRQHPMLGLWFLAALSFIVSLGGHNFHHNYYGLPLILPTAALVGAFVDEATAGTRRPDLYATLFLLVTAVTSLVRTVPFTPAITFDAGRLSREVTQLGPPGLAVVTDEHSPVVSLVILRRMGWTASPSELTPQRIEELRREGATLLVESSFGGWLPESTRRVLPAPHYADDQVRSYVLSP